MIERLHFHFSLSCIGEGNGNPLQCSCLENPRDGRAWWAPSMGSHRVRHDWSDLALARKEGIREGYFRQNKQPTQVTRGPRWERSTGRTLIIGEFQKGTQELAHMGADFCYLCLEGCWQLHSERNTALQSKSSEREVRKKPSLPPCGLKQMCDCCLEPQQKLWRGLIKMLCDKALGLATVGLEDWPHVVWPRQHSTPCYTLGQPQSQSLKGWVLFSLLFIFKILGHTMGLVGS